MKYFIFLTLVLSSCASIPHDKLCVTYTSSFDAVITRSDASGTLLGMMPIPNGLTPDDLIQAGIKACGRESE